MTKEQNELHIQAKTSKAKLILEGYELVCTAIAGFDSGSHFIHSTIPGKKAFVGFRNKNQIQYID